MDRKPNIILIMTDQQRADTIGALGAPWMHTPNLWPRSSAAFDEPAGSTPAVFANHIRGEIAKWTKVVRNAGITPE